MTDDELLREARVYVASEHIHSVVYGQDFLHKTPCHRCGLLNRIDAYLATEQDVAERRLEKHQPCGCVVCTCEDDKQCHGCGAKNCGKHPAGEIPNPVYVQDDRQDVAERVRESRCVWIEEDGYWATSCEHDFTLNDGTPSDNQMTFCMFCGGKIAEESALDLKEIK